jgi:hypothetical protein
MQLSCEQQRDGRIGYRGAAKTIIPRSVVAHDYVYAIAGILNGSSVGSLANRGSS